MDDHVHDLLEFVLGCVNDLDRFAESGIDSAAAALMMHPGHRT